MTATISLAARPSGTAWIGTTVSASVIGAWAVHLGMLLSVDGVLHWWTPLAVMVQTFLHTGLFIVAHDAMHGSVAPGWRRVNYAVGQLALLLYALFPMGSLQKAHWVHHRAPGSAEDPDHTGGEHIGYLRWYLRFMLQYLRWFQIVGLAAIFNIADHIFGFSVPVLIVFWVVPSLLSTFQLFTFGTYLPHRVPPGGHQNPHAANANAWPAWLSFFTCYHFGYHWEHHEYPAVPWWRLPAFHKQASMAAKRAGA